MRHYPYCDYCERWGHPTCCQVPSYESYPSCECCGAYGHEADDCRDPELMGMMQQLLTSMTDLSAEVKSIGESQRALAITLAQNAMTVSELPELLPTQTNIGVDDDCTFASFDSEENLEADIDEPEEEELREEQFEEPEEEPILFAHQVHTMPLSFSLGMVHEKGERQFGAFTGLLAKWHTDDRITEGITEVPSYTISQEETHLFGEDGTDGDTREKEDWYDMEKGHVILERPYWIRTTLPVDMVVLWRKNAGSFKVYKRRWK